MRAYGRLTAPPKAHPMRCRPWHPLDYLHSVLLLIFMIPLTPLTRLLSFLAELTGQPNKLDAASSLARRPLQDSLTRLCGPHTADTTGHIATTGHNVRSIRIQPYTIFSCRPKLSWCSDRMGGR